MSLEHAKNRVYEDFAKKRAEIERMEDGQKKAKALILWHTLWKLCHTNNPLSGIRQLEHEDQTGVYHKP